MTASPAAWTDQAERSNIAVLRLMRWIAVTLGRRVSRGVLHPIALYFLLAGGPAPRASRDYLRRALGRPPRWIERYREDYAVFARIRLGGASTFESMGLDVFSIMMYEDPDLVKEVHRRFSEWSARVVQHLNKMDFDFIWANDDHADTKAPWINMEMWEEFFKPYQMMVAKEIKKPWIFHSDGNLFPILDGLLQLGMNGVHPVQPSAMDINQLKAKYGQRVCIVGNIDLDYTLPRGTEAEVEAEVRDRIEKVGKGGGYMISSANSITDYCKVENVRAMSRAIRKYGKYA